MIIDHILDIIVRSVVDGVWTDSETTQPTRADTWSEEPQRCPGSPDLLFNFVAAPRQVL